MAGRIIAYRNANCGSGCKTKLYMGALNRLDLKKNITPSTERWLAFVKATPAIEGVNIHPHVPKIELSKAFLDYILPRMRLEQTRSEEQTPELLSLMRTSYAVLCLKTKNREKKTE